MFQKAQKNEKARVIEKAGSLSLTAKENQQTVEKDLDKVRALLWESFQLTSRDRIETQTGFEATIRNNHVDSIDD